MIPDSATEEGKSRDQKRDREQAQNQGEMDADERAIDLELPAEVIDADEANDRFRAKHAQKRADWRGAVPRRTHFARAWGVLPAATSVAKRKLLYNRVTPRRITRVVRKAMLKGDFNTLARVHLPRLHGSRQRDWREHRSHYEKRQQHHND